MRRAESTWSVNCFWEAAPAAETFTVKDAVPAASGVPLRTPLEASERPLGNEPAAMVQFLLAAPEAANVCAYGVPTLAAGRLTVVIESVGAGAGVGVGLPPPEPLIVIVNSRCACDGRHQSAEGGSWSLKLTQNDQPP